MSALRYTELFYSLQGEGKFVGTPSVFLRLWGCNFTCSGFSSDQLPAVSGSNIIATDLQDLDTRDFAWGCDSRYSWDPSYSHLSQKKEASEIVKAIHELAANRGPHLVITGGEPLLQQKSLADLIRCLIGASISAPVVSSITFETNCSIALGPELSSALQHWLRLGFGLHFSNSVKLAHSGESYEDRVVPEAFATQLRLDWPATYSFKFVVRTQVSDFLEVREILDVFDEHIRKLGIDRCPYDTYVMPLGATAEQLEEVQKQVAAMALHFGYRYSPRLHVDLYGNAVMT